MTLPHKHEVLQGWGNTPAVTCESYRPEKRRELHELVHTHTGPLIARGLGRSYGDASLQPLGCARTERLDHVIEFDVGQGILRAQAGMSLADVMALVIPRGWFPPVIPGTRHVTIGGALACNVHGKNHAREGDFAEHVLSFRLITASGETIECTPETHSDIFWATAGGMGMTGIIEDLTFRLKPIASASLKSTTWRVENIEEMVAAFEEYKTTADYMVGWIDHMAKANSLGRGLFSAANHIMPADGGEPCAGFSSKKSKLSVPIFFPPFVLNRYSMAVHNWLRFRQYAKGRKTEIVGFDGFFHPLDSIGHWNKLYGKRGFFQYQCLIPDSPTVASDMRAFLAAIHQQGLFSFLGVIKYHRNSKGMLTFPMQGYSIALDFPNNARVRALLPQMDRWLAARGGRIYLAKDVLLTPELFAKMYPQSHEWIEAIHKIDPSSRFTSLMSERLQWKQAA